jgi:hypothetical protein
LIPCSLSSSLAARCVRIDLAELDLLVSILSSLDAFEGLHLALVVGEGSLIVSLASNSREDSRSLDSLGESAEEAQWVLRSVSRYFYVGCHSKLINCLKYCYFLVPRGSESGPLLIKLTRLCRPIHYHMALKSSNNRPFSSDSLILTISIKYSIIYTESLKWL